MIALPLILSDVVEYYLDEMGADGKAAKNAGIIVFELCMIVGIGK